MRRTLAFVVIAGVGCGKQLNDEFCEAHPGNRRCLARTIDAGGLVEGCPAAYDQTVTDSTSRYRVVDDTVSWSTAAADCGDDRTDGPYTHLVVISSDAERQALASLFDRERYIGHTDRKTEGTWLPLTSEPNVYPEIQALQAPPWASGEPSDSGDCATIDSNLELGDRSCSDSRAYLCECDPYPFDPNNI